MIRKQDENYIQWIKRATNAVDSGDIDLEEWATAILGEDGIIYQHETLRRIHVFFKRYIDILTQEQVNNLDDQDMLKEVQDTLEKIKAEKIKVSTANIEYNANARAEARSEMFYEQIADSIARLEPIQVKSIPHTNPTGSSGLLCVYDLHAGSTYEIKGLYDEVVNKYNLSIMKDRLWYLLAQMNESDIVYDDLTIVFGGDMLENVLRLSSLTKLKEPVVDTTIHLSEFLSTWIAQMHDTLQVPINVVVIGGNHDIVRVLGQKAELAEENMAKIICEFLKLRLANCPDITVDDYTDVAIKTIRGTNIMFEHGDGDTIRTMDYFSNLYNITIDEAYYGHLHSQESKSVGIGDVGDRMIYRVGSVVGIDPYAKKIRKGSRASCSFATYTDDGHDWSKTYYLN